MAITLTITVGQTDGGTWETNEGLAATLNLRASPYSSATYNCNSHLGDGVYDFLSVVSGEYKVYNDSTELTKFGTIKVGEDGAVLTTGNQTVGGSKSFSSAAVFTSGFLTNTITERTSGTGVTIDGILLKDNLTTSGIAGLSLNNTLAGNNTFQGDNSFEGNDGFVGTPTFEAGAKFTGVVPTCDTAPSGSEDLANKDYVDSEIAAISVTPYQESTNVIRLIPAGIQETSKVYTSYATAQNFCRGYATNNWRFTIDIEGAGTGGVNITVTDGAIPSNNAFNDYVSLRGKNHNIVLQVDDDTFSVTAGKVVISDVTIARDDNGAGTPAFANFIFNNVYFDFDVSDLGFNGCVFRNCYIKNTGGTITFTSCKGGNVLTNGTLPATVTGWDGLATSDF